MDIQTTQKKSIQQCVDFFSLKPDLLNILYHLNHKNTRKYFKVMMIRGDGFYFLIVDSV
ncbi:hypothetical protein BPO_0530 [Bergeyella porcorum]|uniref:Uncharacterized protein n=1 Tax=Bergeyella porcorum TaxID=1735111 RepID=A0AAU0F0C6_9FLAO